MSRIGALTAIASNRKYRCQYTSDTQRGGYDKQGPGGGGGIPLYRRQEMQSLQNSTLPVIDLRAECYTKAVG